VAQKRVFAGRPEASGGEAETMARCALVDSGMPDRCRLLRDVEAGRRCPAGAHPKAQVRW